MMKKRTVVRNAGKALWHTRGFTGKAAKRGGSSLWPSLPVEIHRRGKGHGRGFFSGLAWPLLGTFVLGAGLTYLLDPNSGRRRRGLLRDKAVRYGKVATNGLEKRRRDLTHRFGGTVSELQSRSDEQYVSDPVLAERVRSKLGRATSNPGAIHVSALNGQITLSGPVLAGEVDRLLKEVAQVRGVAGVDNRLSVHQQPENIPSLKGIRTQSESPRSG